MQIKSLKDFRIWQLARRFADAVSAILVRPQFRRDQKLRDQIADALDSVVSNSGEGFGLESDKGFARYLEIARGSNNEAISHLAVALGRRYLSLEEFTQLEGMSDELGRRMTSLIQYLRREDRKRRW